ncbi:MAG TPA: RNA polymerase sigma factor [Acidobacteriota bacterium]|nr:RNA polymerase sigma factor [Acidobacteriota bacterium]HNJ39451.1 RNA polymerase sigma factor [Acidobacteriota bacterium]
MQPEINDLVLEAQNGSRTALESVVAYAQKYVYNLALRMLQHPMDAEDATQEILIKLITHLGQFRGESSFSTWMYRIASTTLLNLVERDQMRNRVTFEGLSLRLEASLTHYEQSPEEQYLAAELIEEVRRNCTLGMLMCLNREDRLALILGEVLEMSGIEAASILGVPETAYRKRLSRARQTLVAFVSRQCGIVNPDSSCRCHKHVRNKIQVGQLDPHNLKLAQATDAVSALNFTQAGDRSLGDECQTMALIRSHPQYAAAHNYGEMIDRMLSAEGHFGTDFFNPIN